MQKEVQEKLFSKFNHDLRGSFVSILGYTDILTDPRENVTPQETTEFIGRIDYRTKEAYGLLEDFINWLKIEHYNNNLTKETIRLYEAFAEVISAFKNSFDKKNITIKNETEKNIAVFMDMQILQSSLKNIFKFIENSIKENTMLQIVTTQKVPAETILSFNSNLNDYEKENLKSINKDNPNVANIPNEILFAKYFIELSNGKFELMLDEKRKVKISVSLPERN